MDTDYSVVIAGGRVWVEVEEGVSRTNGNGKIQLKKYYRN